jgi:hypothetical protein
MDGKTTTLKLGGQERTLCYDLNALAEIGERLKIKIRLSHLSEDLMGQEFELGALRTIFWAGFIHAEPDLTEKEAGAWMTSENMGECLEGFFALFGGIAEGVTKTTEALNPPSEEVEAAPKKATKEKA